VHFGVRRFCESGGKESSGTSQLIGIKAEWRSVNVGYYFTNLYYDFDYDAELGSETGRHSMQPSSHVCGKSPYRCQCNSVATMEQTIQG